MIAIGMSAIAAASGRLFAGADVRVDEVAEHLVGAADDVHRDVVAERAART